MGVVPAATVPVKVISSLALGAVGAKPKSAPETGIQTVVTVSVTLTSTTGSFVASLSMRSVVV